MTISRFVLGAVLVSLVCLSFWATGRKIVKGVFRNLLWWVCAISLGTAVVVLMEDNRTFAASGVALLICGFAVYIACVARSLRPGRQGKTGKQGKPPQRRS